MLDPAKQTLKHFCSSVTRLCEISPLWENFGILWLFHEGFILYLANFGTYFGNFYAIWQIGIDENGQILGEKIRRNR